jgi:pyrroline-5-carboxylate reductase
MTMEAPQVVLVGCGNMGYAMLSGWLASGKLKADQAFVVEPNAELRARAAAVGCSVTESVEGLDADLSPDLVVVAVKPQVLAQVLEGYKRFAGGKATFLSIVAGAPVATFERILGDGASVVRCMPNTPAAIGKGMMVTFDNAHVSSAVSTFVADLLSASGRVAAISDESLMDAVTAVSGSGPAYVFHFIECLTEAGVKAGLPPETAALLASQTVMGAGVLAAESNVEPAELRRQVTSPNGTTAAALDVLMGQDRLKTLLTEAVEAARKRAVELGR